MEGYGDATYGDRFADVYDDWYADVSDVEGTTDLVAELAQHGPVLELGIGTGRIALPLAARNIPVDGIELSPHMVARLRAKPGGDRINVTLGDMSVATTGQRYGLVYLVFNTIFNLLTADDQVRCFENAARHLTPDGHFVVETALPHAWIAPGAADYVHAERVGTATVMLDVARYDPVTQLLEENHLRLTANGITMQPIVCRLITPGEMDLMARIAGLRLVARFATWERTAFDAHSRAHISVYGFESTPPQ